MKYTSTRDQIAAEKIAWAEEMLGRLGDRPAYEPNYATEKLWAATRACVEALAAFGDAPTPAQLAEWVERAWTPADEVRGS